MIIDVPKTHITKTILQDPYLFGLPSVLHAPNRSGRQACGTQVWTVTQI